MTKVFRRPYIFARNLENLPLMTTTMPRGKELSPYMRARICEAKDC